MRGISGAANGLSISSTRQAQHGHQQLAKTNGNPKPIHAGGHSGPPLRGGFVSMRGISGAEPSTKREFHNIRRSGRILKTVCLRQQTKVINAERFVVMTCHIPRITRCIRKRNSCRETSRGDLTAKVFANIRQRNIGSSLLPWAE